MKSGILIFIALIVAGCVNQGNPGTGYENGGADNLQSLAESNE